MSHEEGGDYEGRNETNWDMEKNFFFFRKVGSQEGEQDEKEGIGGKERKKEKSER